MRFEEYCKIMKEHGIGELYFRYNKEECSITMDILDYSFDYAIYFGEEGYNTDDFDEIISLKYLSIGKTLKDIWDEIEILSIDGVAENDYDVETCSCDFVKKLKAKGELQWSYEHNTTQSFFMQLRYAVLGVLIIPILSMLIPLFGAGNWNIVLLSVFLALITLMVTIVVMLRNRMAVNYQVTTKRIFVFNGLEHSTSYDNIKKIKCKKSIFKKDYGTIQISVKKGLSINYCLENIPNPEEVYNLIMQNIQKNSEE